MLSDPNECIERAQGCRELAAKATDPLAKHAYNSVAEKWEGLAQELADAHAIIAALNMTRSTSDPYYPPPCGDKA